MDLQFGQEGEQIYTASSDHTVGVFDYITGTRVKRMKGTTKFDQLYRVVQKLYTVLGPNNGMVLFS